MEGIPQITDSFRLPVEIPVDLCFFDHHIEGKVVFPAVEAMQLLARTVKTLSPDANVNTLTQTRFDKFLYIQTGAEKANALVDAQIHSSGGITAHLLTKVKSKNTSITRTKVHATAHFPQRHTSPPPPPLDLQAFLEGVCVEISPEEIYRELVPFGPSYQNILAPLHISENGAIARIGSPKNFRGRQSRNLLGSPFNLDAAFHAACVWSQCFARTVAFPVGLKCRIVHLPTCPQKQYIARIAPIQTDPKLLTFDIWIYDQDGTLCESIKGVQMRDVSAGRITPPPWLPARAKQPSLERIKRNCRAVSVLEIKTLTPFAKRSLSELEKKRFQKMGTRRRQSFLAARLACKQVSRRLSGNDMHTPASRITTVLPESERPCCHLMNTAAPIACSVSHDDRFAIAVVADARTGIDVEKISARVFRSQNLFMHTEETELARAFKFGAIEAAIRIWSIKEAVAKAIDLNLAEAWHRVTVKHVGKNKSRIQIDAKGPYSVFHDSVEAHVFTLVCLPRTFKRANTNDAKSKFRQ